MDDSVLTLTHATERDVDLLLVEEFKCSTEFVSWFLATASLGTGGFEAASSTVTHSRRRTHNRREIDICLTIYSVDGRTQHLLIENKLDASEQVEQAESYRAEAELLARTTSAGVFSVLISPATYARANAAFASKFDANISYEHISKYFAAKADLTTELGRRCAHRQELLQQAITKSRRGYEAVPVEHIEKFNKGYINLLEMHCPELKAGPSMRKEGRPGESKTMIFAPETLPQWDWLPQMRLVHQLREGNANVCFYTWGGYFNDLAALVAADLAGTPYRVVPTINKRVSGRSGLMLVAETPPIDNLSSSETQLAKILEGIRITEALRKWIWDHQPQIKRWANIVNQASVSGALVTKEAND
jgi:hypothetical protein